MAAQVTLCLCSLFSIVASLTCPSFTCDNSLPTNICASKVTEQSFKVNANGCQEGYYCMGSWVSIWSQIPWLIQQGNYPENIAKYLDAYSDDTPTIPCFNGTLNFTSSIYKNITINYPCGTRDPKKHFKNGELVVSCSANSDCELVDGTSTFCWCTFKSGAGICYPHVSNDDFLGDDYWRDCGANNTITDWNTIWYWSIYSWAWLINQGGLSCDNVFAEMNSLQAFQDQITTGATYGSPNLNGFTAVALGLLGLLALH